MEAVIPLGLIVLTFLWVFPLWHLLRRVGHAPALALLAIVPPFGLLLAWWIAFGRWPAVDPHKVVVRQPFTPPVTR